MTADPTLPMPSHALIKDRFDVIEEFVRDRSVLDVGCVDSRPSKAKTTTRIECKPNLLFQRIVNVNPDVVGVDIDREGVDHLNSLGYQVVCADAETMDLGQKFDTIVAGEIIEHLENPGRFLRTMRKHLADDGVLILTTPNPFAAHHLWKIWRYGRPSVHREHTCWFDPITLDQLLRRTGLEPVESYWVHSARSLLKSWRRYFRVYFSDRFLFVARRAA